MREYKVRTVAMPWESWSFLFEEQHRQRCESGREISEKHWGRARREFDRFSRNGYKEVGDGDFGGCKGDPRNAWQERRWTSWSIEDMKRMLDEAGLPYGEDGVQERIDAGVYL